MKLNEITTTVDEILLNSSKKSVEKELKINDNGKASEVEVKVKKQNDLQLPQYKTAGSAGCDVRANNKLPVWISPGDAALIPTGLFVAIPQGYEIQVRPRSGLALGKTITVLNTPGTIDSDYRDEIGVILINHGKTRFEVKKGDRIAQLVLQKVERIKWGVEEELDGTDRKGGFGSTGTK
jgi:dUTP pyrophosphatase